MISCLKDSRTSDRKPGKQKNALEECEKTKILQKDY